MYMKKTIRYRTVCVYERQLAAWNLSAKDPHAIRPRALKIADTEETWARNASF